MENNEAYEVIKNMMASKKEINKLSEVDDVDEAVSELNTGNIYDDTFTDEESRYLIQDDLEETIGITKKQPKYVDPDKIDVATRYNAIEKNKYLDKVLGVGLFGKTSTVEIIASQSGYTCKMSPLNNSDSFRILNSQSTLFENERTTYKTIYDKITEFSCGPMDFIEWLKKTSVADLDTFYYGLYCATYLDEGTFKFSCSNPECGEITEQKIRNKSLIRTADYAEMKKLEDTISKESKSKEDMARLSLLNDMQIVKCNKSGLAFEIKNPSLFDLLELYRTIDEKVLQKRSDADINSALCVNGMLIPTEKENEYIPDRDINDIFKAIDNMPISDAAELRNEIIKKLEKNHVTYSIKSVKCHKCGKEINNIPLNLRQILFTVISESRR